jgi:hypothetical protein
MNKDFDNLQVGDTVAISDGGKRMIATVVKLTKAYITIRIVNAKAESALSAFSRKTGLMKGSQEWHPTSTLFVPTKQEIEEITQEQNQRRLRIAAAFALQQTENRIKQFSEDELQSIINALEPYYKRPMSYFNKK